LSKKAQAAHGKSSRRAVVPRILDDWPHYGYFTPVFNLSAQLSGGTLGLRLLGGMALSHQNGFARLRKRLRIPPLSWAA